MDKVCTICKKSKDSLKFFSKDKSRLDKLDPTCKSCRKKQRESRKKARKDIQIPMYKKCSSCSKKLSNENFDKKPGSNDGLHTHCKICKKKTRLKIKGNNENKNLPKKYTKICTKCNISKSKNDFHQNLYSTDSLNTICVVCDKKKHKDWRDENPEKIRKYRTKTYFKHYHKKRKENPHLKLEGNLRNRVRMALKRDSSTKFKNTFELIGCSPCSLKKWLEYQFDSKMSWNNYGTYWQIDHVVPCSYFDLKDRKEQFKCFNWRNCRPLEASANLSKNDKYLPVQILLQEVKVSYYEQQIQIAGNS